MKHYLKVFLIILIWVWSCNGGIAQDYINMTGIKGKDISRLFDGDLTTNFNASNTNDPLAFPFEAYIVLDSVKNISQFSYYVKNSSQTSGFNVRFLDQNFNQVGFQSTPSIGKYQSWTNFTVNYPGVRFIQVLCSDPGLQWDGINEFRITAVNVSKAPSIYPAPYNYIPMDYGVFAHGINILGDKINKILPTKDTALEKVARAARVGWVGTEVDYYPNHYVNPKDEVIWLGRHGFNHTGNLYSSLRRRGFHTMMYKSGGGIGWLDSNTAKQNTTWLGYTSAQDKKYAEPALNYAKLITLYGKSKGSVRSIGGDSTSGQNTINIFEWDNEPNRWWKQLYYHTPKQYYHTLRDVYHQGKQADPSALIYAGALPGIDTSFWKAVYFQHYLENKFLPFPADGFNFNMYLNDGTEQRAGTVGISPEKYNILLVLQRLKTFFNRLFGKPVQWTEFGYAVDPNSPYEAPNRTEQANWTLRLKAIAQASFIERMYYYAFYEDNAGANFHTMGSFRDSNDWKTVIPYPVAYGLAQELYVERNSPWFSDVIKLGQDTGVYVTKKGQMLKIWHPTKEVTYQLPAPSKIYKQNYNKWLPDSTTAQTITVGPYMTWVQLPDSMPPIPPTPTDCNCKTIKAIIKTEYRDSATNKLIRTATATIYLR